MLEPLIGATVAETLDQDLSINSDMIAYLVKPWTRQVQTGDNQFKDVTYPVAANVITDVTNCEVQAGGLYNVAPNSNIKNLILISQASDISAEISEQIPQRRGTNIEVDIAVNVWMADHQGSIHLLKANIIKLLQNTVWRQQYVPWAQGDTIDPDNNIYINKLRCRFVRDISGNPFNDYDFGKDQALQNQSYASFGLVFKLAGLIMYGCVPDMPRFDESVC